MIAPTREVSCWRSAAGGGRHPPCHAHARQCPRAFEMMCERAVSRGDARQTAGQHQMMQDLIAESAVEMKRPGC